MPCSFFRGEHGLHTLYLSLGSNLGDRRLLLDQATAQIASRVGCITAQSDYLETEPWGFDSEHPFLNIALCVATSLSAEEVLHQTQSIEQALGRRHKSQGGIYHDRPIDIDLLLYDESIVHSSELTIPHPQMHLRRFVLEPLVSIAPTLRHPVLSKTMTELLEGLP